MDLNEPRALAETHVRHSELPLGAWPLRSRRLLQELFDLAVSWLHPRLQLGVDAYAEHLVLLAGQARNGIDQQTHLDTRARLPLGAQLLRNTVIQVLADRFAHIGTPTDPASSFAHTPSLSLVNPAQQDTLATLDSMTARGNARGSLALVELGHRLAVLVAKPPLEGADMPLGPRMLGHALHKGALTMGLTDDQHLDLLRHLDQSLQHDLTAFYEHLNKHLRDDGLLPQLRVYSGSWLPDDAEDQEPCEVHSDAAEAATEATQATGTGHARSGAPVVQTPGTRNILETLRQLLAQRHAQPRSPCTSASVVSADELLAALAGLQRVVGGKRQAQLAPGNTQQLRTQLLKLLGTHRSGHGAATTLSPEHNDTLELVGMLFEQLARQTRMGGSTHAVLAGLQLPIMRTAMNDQGFFEQGNHPAMQLLSAATNAANDWLDAPGSEPDRSLQDKLQVLVDRANRAHPSADLYTALLADIEQHLHVLKRRAQAAERRHIEAMEGRERLDRARQCATDLMSERLSVTQPSYLVRTLLDHAWTDVLALTVLRHGETSAALTGQLNITDQLLGQMPVDDPAQLKADVETGLAQIGMSADEAEQVARHLITADEESSDAPKPVSTTEMLVRLKGKQRFGSTPLLETPANLTQPQTPAAYAAIETQLRQLPFGTWFEFADADSGLWQARKLAWFSTTSGQALFVNRRGQRARETSLAQLAEAISKGQARETRLDRDGVMDRARQKLASLLHQSTSAMANREG